MKLDLVWHEYLELISVVLVTVSIGLFGKIVLSNIGDNKLPLIDESDFTKLVDYSIDFRVFARVTSLAALLVSFKVIVVLKNKFPSFGVLFDTIRLAKKDIMNFGLITILIFITFALMGNIAFGISLVSFSTFKTSLSTLFAMSLGKIDFKSMEVSNNSIAEFFFLVFMALTFFILINMFLAIILSNFIKIRNRDQLLLEAKALMIKEDSNKFIQTILNFLLFRVKSNINEEALEYERLSRLDCVDPVEQDKINDRLRKLENSILHQSKQSMIGVFKYNLGQITQFGKFGNGLMTQEQYLSKINNSIREILLKKRKNEI